MLSKQDQDKLQSALAAVNLVKDHDIVGLGTGSTSVFAIHELAKLVKKGLTIKGVPSSIYTGQLAESLGIKLLPLNEVGSIDISIDGADEFTKDLQLIKGGGGALFREKIVASLSKNQIIITDSSKKVDQLGAFKVPVEVVPIAFQHVVNELEKLNGKVKLRVKDNLPFLTDNHNHIVDVDFGLIDNPKVLATMINQIQGILAHGLFIDLTARVIMSSNGELEIFSN